MKLLKFKSYAKEVSLLEEILVKLGYNVWISKYFGKDTHRAIIDFQSKNNLVVDGLVGIKTWSKLFAQVDAITADNDKFLSEKDVINFANEYALDLATVKAVNEVESQGKGFLITGQPKILFEGHVFWRQLEAAGIDPNDLLNHNSKDVLYKSWTRAYYLGGSREHDRMQKAAGLVNSKKVREAALSSASWGSFQIMGYHWQPLGYPSINDFVKKMEKHEREHLKAFGKFISHNKYQRKSLTHWLKEKSWAKFARAYNGPGYKTNNYDVKLKRAYEKYNKL